MKQIVKIFLCIGIFLLIIGIVSYGYLSYKEGFQTYGSGSGLRIQEEGFCENVFMNNRQCISQCNSAYNPNPTPLYPETSDEQTIYDTYESFNLNNLNTGLPVQTTPLVAFNTASALSDFDKQSIPWDYDNINLDPQLVLWGTVHPAVSRGIFDKAYTKHMLQSANSANFIQTDPTNGRNTYTSTLFLGAEVPTGASALGVQFAESLVNIAGGEAFEQFVQYLNELNTRGIQRHNAILGAMKNPSNINLTYDQVGKKIDNMAKGQSKVIQSALTEMDRNRLLQNNLYTFGAASGELNFLGRAKLEHLNTFNGQLSAAIHGSPKPEIQAQLETLHGDLSRKNLLTAPNKPASRRQISVKGAAAVRSAEATVRSLETHATKSGKQVLMAGVRKPVRGLLSRIAVGSLNAITAPFRSIYTKRLLNLLFTVIAPAQALGGICSSLSATEATLIGATPVTFGVSGIAAAALTLEVTACWTVYALLHAFFISCYTWIPPILSAIVDESTAICPPGYPFNLYRAIVNSDNKGGELQWLFISGLPEVGALISAFGPFVCWSSIKPPDGVTVGSDWRPLKPVLIQNVHPPAYYFDPTLSLFTVEKVYSSVYSSYGENPGNQIVSGMLVSNPAYYEPALYKDPNGHYPIWVDYANRKMLDKMAQFYYDSSRKNMYINLDGTATFEYISKFYGIISSSEFSCDVQCEISEITVDTHRGIKLCERVLPPPEAGGACTWHDRRFYWYVDITAGINLQTMESHNCGQCYTRIQAQNINGFPATDPCVGILGVSTIYDVNGQPEIKNVTTAQTKCAEIYLMKNPPDDPRMNWNPQKRMNDNMDKFFVTGCTYIDGTAADAADVSNQLQEGTQIGDTIVALGTPGGTYNQPVVGELKYPNEIPATATQILPPDSNSCELVKRSFTTYASTTTPEARAIQNQGEAQITAGLTGGGSRIGSNNPAVLRSASTSSPWIFKYKQNNTPQTVLNTIAYDGTTKYLDMQWYGCVDPSAGEVINSLNCHLHDKWASILYRSVVSGLSMIQIPGLGGKFQWSMIAYDTISSVFVGVETYLDCLTDTIRKQQGTFLLNGMIVTSQTTPDNANFIMFQGPIMPFAPGYTPTINFSKNTPPLSLRDCVNRHTLRYFINTFRSNPMNSPYPLNKILNISPRPKNDNNDSDYCVFNFQYTTESTSQQKNDVLALKMNLNGFGKDVNNPYININTYLYQPTNILNTVIPKAVPFTQNANPIYIFSDSNSGSSSTSLTRNGKFYGPYNPTLTPSYPNVPPPSQLIQPDYRCQGALDCGNCILQARLFTQFNQRHLGKNISLDTDSSAHTENICTNPIKQTVSGSSNDYIPPGPYKSVLNYYTPDPFLSNGELQCVYHLNIDTFTPNTINTFIDVDDNNTKLNIDPSQLGTRGMETRVVTMFLNPISNPSINEICLYDLKYDDLSSNLWYTPIPVLYFDVPPAVAAPNNNFGAQTGIPTCKINCSQPELIQRVITQFNTSNSQKKISSVSRAYTPLIDGSVPACDFDVEILRTIGNTRVANNETVRFYMKKTNPIKCMFDWAGDDTNITKSGLSLNNSRTLGALPNIIYWSTSFLQGINQQLDNLLLNILGLDGVNTLNSVSVNALSAANTVLAAAIETQTLEACPAAPCNNPYILQKILNRFNFDNYPKYPTEQYGAQKNSIVQFRKAGISSPTQCQVELVNTITIYDDFLYNRPNSTQPYLQHWAFDLITNNPSTCDFKVKDLSGTDIENGVMDIKSNPYALQAASSQIFGLNSSKEVRNPTISTLSSGSSKVFSYEEPVIDCLGTNILNAVKTAYDSIPVYPNGPNHPKFNTLKHILQSFNPVPNVCEYKARAVHTYYDADYEVYYTVPSSTGSFTMNNYTYIVATWNVGSDYDVETGNLLKNKPTITEFHLPDLIMKKGEYYRSDETDPLNLPYIANVVTNPSSVSYDTSNPNKYLKSPAAGKTTLKDF